MNNYYLKTQFDFFLADRFKDFQIPGDTDYDESNHNIMNCNCPSPCSYTYYDAKFNTAPIESKDDIKIDVFHAGPTTIRYKRKVVMNKLYLLGNFIY